MPTPTSPSLKEHAAAFVKTTAWGTALPVGAGKGLSIINDGGLQLRRAYQPLEELDAPVHKGGDLDVNDPVDFSPTFNARYIPAGMGALIASHFGADVVTTPGGTLPRLHTLSWADNLRGIHGCFCVERPGKVYEVPSVKVMGLDFTLQAGRLVGTASLRGDDVKDDSAVNSATQMDAVTASPFGERLRWKEGALRMNAEGGATLVGTTPLQLNALDISFKRAFDSEHALGALPLIEPEENGIEEISVRIGFPRMNAENAAFFAAAFKAEAYQKLMISFIGAQIETTYYYEWNFMFPSMKVVEFIPGPQGGVVPASMLLRARQTGTNPTGMAQARPYMTIQEVLTTSYLA
jgi:hypothetical protein